MWTSNQKKLPIHTLDKKDAQPTPTGPIEHGSIFTTPVTSLIAVGSTCRSNEVSSNAWQLYRYLDFNDSIICPEFLMNAFFHMFPRQNLRGPADHRAREEGCPEWRSKGTFGTVFSHKLCELWCLIARAPITAPCARSLLHCKWYLLSMNTTSCFGRVLPPQGKNFLYCRGNYVICRDLANPLDCFTYNEHPHQATVAKYAPSGFYICSGGEFMDACSSTVWRVLSLGGNDVDLGSEVYLTD